jgi:hypothetical protein
MVRQWGAARMRSLPNFHRAHRVYELRYGRTIAHGRLSVPVAWLMSLGRRAPQSKSKSKSKSAFCLSTPCENLLRAPYTRHVAPSRDLVRPGEATRGSRCAGRSALRAQASAHRLARIMSCQFDVRDDLDHQTLAAFESTSTSGRSPVRVRREHVAPEASWKARLAERLHFCCSCEQ